MQIRLPTFLSKTNIPKFLRFPLFQVPLFISLNNISGLKSRLPDQMGRRSPQNSHLFLLILYDLGRTEQMPLNRVEIRVLVAPSSLVLAHLLVKLKDVVEVIPHLLHGKGRLGLGGVQLGVLGEQV